jgi:response regulator RpfG family c-di-GMP phosphodiesterase
MGENALVVAINTELRMRLKEAVNLAEHFEKVFVSHSLREARTQYEVEPTLDGIFISNEFAKSDIPNFIEQTKANSACQDAAYILVLDEKDSQASEIALSMLSGIDALLLSPFSVDRITEVVETVIRLSAERRAKRKEGMIRFLVKNIKSQLSRTAKAQASSKNGSHMQLRALQDLCKPIETFDKPTRDIYFELLVTIFSAARPPKSKGYQGASNRVRQMFEKWEKKSDNPKS